MPNNNNLINLVNNKKPVELVQELKNETPSFEEFMKTYETDANLNYDDLNGGGIGETRGYGPCWYWDCPYLSRFYLKIGFSCDKFEFRDANEEKGIYKSCNWITMENIQGARDVLSKFEEGNKRGKGDRYFVTERTSFYSGNCSEWDEDTRNACKKHAEIMRRLKNYINYHEMGGEVYEPEVDFKNDSGCSVIM